MADQCSNNSKKFASAEKSESAKEVFYKLKKTRQNWTDRIEGKQQPIVLNFFHHCKNRFRQRRFEPFTVHCLPQQGTINLQTLGVVHVIRFRDPWNMHVIFEETILDCWAKASYDFANYISRVLNFSREHFLFESPLDMYRGFTVILSHYVNFLENTGSYKTRLELKPGDLVVVSVPRDKRAGKRKCLAYRGVISEQVDVIDEDLNMIQDALIVFLLDTGEKQVVTKKFLFPLPRPFTLCPPLAVKCALHGVSPVGPEWSDKAGKVVRTLVDPAQGVTLSAEFFTDRKSSDISCSSTEDLLDSVTNMEPYFVELYAHPTGITEALTQETPEATNISTQLCQDKLGLEWSLTSQRTYVREHTATQTKLNPWRFNEKKRIVKIKREAALHLCASHPQPINIMSETQEHLKRVLLQKRPDLKNEIIAGTNNVIALKLSDPNELLKEVAVPRLFTKVPRY